VDYNNKHPINIQIQIHDHHIGATRPKPLSQEKIDACLTLKILRPLFSQKTLKIATFDAIT